MNLFEKVSKENHRCDICGCDMIAVHGGGWDNDRIYCTNQDCQAEVVFPTSTVIEDEE